MQREPWPFLALWPFAEGIFSIYKLLFVEKKLWAQIILAF